MLRTFKAHAVRNRQLAGILLMTAAFNALIGLIHTLEPASGWLLLTAVLHAVLIAQFGVLFVAAALGQERLGAGTVVASTIFITQAHAVFIRPSLLGWAGWPIFVVSALVIGVFGCLYWRNVRQIFRRPVATVTQMTTRRHLVGTHRHAA